MTEGRFAPDGKSVIFNAPEMEGVECEVQHSVRSGKGFCPTPGLCGVGVVTLPTGQPRVVLQIKHSDGTSLSATLTQSIGLAILECIADGMAEAQRIAEAAKEAKGRAS
jgi:hypothetical protein